MGYKLKLKVYFYLIIEYLFMLNLTIVLLIIRTTREIFSIRTCEETIFSSAIQVPLEKVSRVVLYTNGKLYLIRKKFEK